MKITSLRYQSGFGIVEILVFSVVFGLVVVGVMSMINAARKMEVESDYFRQARSILHGALENSDYDFDNYNLLGPDVEVTIDTLRLDTNKVPATLTVTVSSEQVESIGGDDIPYKSITANIAWNTVDGPQSLQIEKRLAEPR